MFKMKYIKGLKILTFLEKREFNPVVVLDRILNRQTINIQILSHHQIHHRVH